MTSTSQKRARRPTLLAWRISKEWLQEYGMLNYLPLILPLADLNPESYNSYHFCCRASYSGNASMRLPWIMYFGPVCDLSTWLMSGFMQLPLSRSLTLAHQLTRFFRSMPPYLFLFPHLSLHTWVWPYTSVGRLSHKLFQVDFKCRQKKDYTSHMFHLSGA